MKFIMTQVELERAVSQYVRKLIPGLDVNTVISPEFKATRGADGFTAEVDILSPEDMAEAAPKVEVPEVTQAPKEPVKRVAAPTPAPVQQPAAAPAPVVEQAAAQEVVEAAPEAPFDTTEDQGAGALQEEAPAPAAAAPAKRPLFGLRQPS